MLACTDHESDRTTWETGSDSAGINEVHIGGMDSSRHLSLSDEPVVTIGSAASPETELFGVSSATRLSMGAVVVANSGTGDVLVFDDDGTLRTRFGGIGGGPGEFVAHGSLYLVPTHTDDVLVQYDHPLGRKLVRFDLDGSVVDESIMPPGTLFPGGSVYPPQMSPAGYFYILAAPGEGPATDDLSEEITRRPAYILRYRYSGDGPDTVGVYSGSEVFAADVGPRLGPGGMPFPGPRPIAPLLAANSVHASGGDPWILVAGDQAIPRIDIYDEDGRLNRRLTWTSRARRPSRDDMRQLEAMYLASQASDPAAAQRALRILPSASRTPEFRKLMVDRVGFIWIEQYPLPTDEWSEWTVVSPEGRAEARMRMVRDLEPLEIGSDYMLALRRDSLDVPRVELWIFRR